MTVERNKTWQFRQLPAETTATDIMDYVWELNLHIFIN